MSSAPPLASRIDTGCIRQHFPALGDSTILLDNAGGSQVPKVVAERIRDYMLHTYVQLDAPYPLSQHCTDNVARAHEFINLLMNGRDTGKVILGSSTTVLLNMLAGCYRSRLQPGDEIVIAQSGHEANIGCWNALERDGIVIRTWPFDRAHWGCAAEGLRGVLSSRTRIVAFPHVSNLLGTIEDVRALTAIAHAAGARVVVDGVAYAPHRAIDVARWGVDWYVNSTYKVYGPHMGALFGRTDAIAELRGPNHFFIHDDEVPYKFELGGASHEGCAGLLALGDYLLAVAGRPPGAALDRAVIEQAFGVMAACEQPLIERLIAYLRSRSDVTIIGPDQVRESRVGTISFVHDSRSSREIAESVCARGIGIRNGHMYAWRLCETLGLDPEDGVVRVSLVHYNSMSEIERLIEALDGALP